MEMRWVKRRVRRSSSSFESCFGSTATPPFAPPNGMSMRAVFHVMMVARPSTSSWSASGWYRIPPLQGPRAPLCWMRKPVNTSIRPSSMRTGTSTWTSRNGRMRMRRMYSSRLIRLAARWNWLSTIDFPVIARAGRPVAVMGCSSIVSRPGREEARLKPRLGAAAQAASCAPAYGRGRAASSLADEAAIRQPAFRMLRFGQRVGAIRPPVAPPGGVGEHPDHVGAGDGRLRQVLEDEHQAGRVLRYRSEEHTSELQSRLHLVCRLLLEKKKKKHIITVSETNNIKAKC